MGLGHIIVGDPAEVAVSAHILDGPKNTSHESRLLHAEGLLLKLCTGLDETSQDGKADGLQERILHTAGRLWVTTLHLTA